MPDPREIPCPALPGATALAKLRRRLALSPEAEDVYLAYAGSPDLHLAGFLISCRGDIDRVIAYCPLAPGLTAGTPAWSAEVVRQLHIAARVAEEPQAARRAADVVWLGYVGTGDREVPNWVYAMACVPLSQPWDGELRSPRPFCPALFGRMATQPQAAWWLERRRSLSPAATAGGPERPPAAPHLDRVSRRGGGGDPTAAA